MYYITLNVIIEHLKLYNYFYFIFHICIFPSLCAIHLKTIAQISHTEALHCLWGTIHPQVNSRSCVCFTASGGSGLEMRPFKDGSDVCSPARSSDGLEHGAVVWRQADLQHGEAGAGRLYSSSGRWRPWIK